MASVITFEGVQLRLRFYFCKSAKFEQVCPSKTPERVSLNVQSSWPLINFKQIKFKVEVAASTAFPKAEIEFHQPPTFDSCVEDKEIIVEGSLNR